MNSEQVTPLEEEENDDLIENGYVNVVGTNSEVMTPPIKVSTPPSDDDGNKEEVMT